MRRAGRTTRMLADAIEKAKSGRAVYVVCATEDHRRHLQNINGAEALAVGVKFETAETLGNLNWETMTLEGAHPNCLVIADHYAIEARFAKMLDMLHVYDEVEVYPNIEN